MGSTGDIFFFQHGVQRGKTQADQPILHRQDSPEQRWSVNLKSSEGGITKICCE